MKYPTEFYYKFKSSSKAYTSKNTGNLDIVRFTTGKKDYWVTKNTYHWKPKHLILADWRLIARQGSNIEPIYQVLLNLIQNNDFAVFLHLPVNTKQPFLRLTPESLSLLHDKNTYNNMLLMDSEAIKQQATLHLELPYETLVILDDYWIDNLVNDTPHPRSWMLTDLLKLSESDRSKVIQNLHADKQSQQYLVNNYFDMTDKTSTKAQASLKSNIPELQCMQKITSASLSTKNYKDLIEYKKRITNHDSIHLHPEDALQISALSVQGDGVFLLNTLSLLPALQHLKLISITSIETLGILKPQSQILEILLSASYISSDNFLALLLASTNLKTLQINDVKGLDDTPLNFGGQVLPQLRKLSITESELSTENLRHLLTASPALHTLTISPINTDTEIVLPTSLPNIKQFTLVAVTTNLEQLSNCLSLMPNLDVLHLTDAKLMGDPLKFKPPLNLQVLKLKNCAVNNNSTSNLLKTLLLTCKKIKLIELDKDTISEQEILGLLAINPGVTSLRIVSCRNITTSSIETIQIKFPNIQISYLSDNIKLKVLPPKDPIYDSTSQRDFKPYQEDFHFIYIKQTNNKSQAVLIDQLCQYLSLTKQHRALIHKMKNGLCYTLSNIFLKTPINRWNKLMDCILSWDGTPSTINSNLRDDCDYLITQALTYQFDSNHEIKQFLGDNLYQFLIDLNNVEGGWILENPYHAIAIKRRLKPDIWEIYDPNFPNGIKSTSNHQECMQIIQQSLGKVIAVENFTPSYTPRIDSSGCFFEQGGLWFLISCANADELFEQLTTENLSKTSLQGLLSRNMHGTPAWVTALLTTKLSLFTQQLLIQFINNYPADYEQQLQFSIEVLTPFEKYSCIENIINHLLPINASLAQNLINLIKTSSHITLYERALTTWYKKEPNSATMLEYTNLCLKPTVGSRLVRLNSTAEVQGLAANLQKASSSLLLYIHSPEDLICQQPFIEVQNGIGKLKPGPSGRLYDFLMHAKAHPDKKSILLINYENFKACDIVRLNSLLDTPGSIDKVAIPNNVLVIGLLNKQNPHCYQGEDFYSRFKDKLEGCPLPSSELSQAIPTLDWPEQDLDISTTTINLFHSPNWETILLGSWVLQGNQLVFKEGALLAALEADKPIVLSNAPWENKAFINFWQQALLTGKIHQDGRIISLPPHQQWIKTTGYDWKNLRKNLYFTNNYSTGSQILNSSLLPDFFSIYVCKSKTNSLIQIPGIIAKSQGKELPLYLSHSLSVDEWGQLLTHCQLHQVQLEITCAPGVELPEALKSLSARPLKLKPAATVILSTDRDSTVAKLTQGKDWSIIDVSECLPSDLMPAIQGNFDEQTLNFNFYTRPSYLKKALEQGKHIILCGHFSEELVERLTTLLLAKTHAYKRKLVLISNQPELFQFLSTQAHDPTPSEKKSLLRTHEKPDIVKQIDHLLAKNPAIPFSKLQAYCDFWRDNPDSGFNAEAGMNFIHLPKLKPLQALQVKTAEQEATLFNADRLKTLTKSLANNPFIFLSGFSGVGKSTFVQNIYFQQAGIRGYTGEQELKNWATNIIQGQLKVLFIDEANLSSSDWTCFEGLIHSPRGILIEGVLHPLSSEHKVIFAGNPLSYGDERKLATLFKRHGKTLIFEPLSTACLYQEILKPVWEGSSLDGPVAESLSKYFLEVYRFLLQSATQDVPITPRELQMMALLSLSYCQRNREDKPMDVARHYAYWLAKNFVLSEEASVFDSHFKPLINLSRITAPLTKKDYLLTQSRLPLRFQLEDLLHLRSFRRQPKIQSTIAYGGLGGIIIEGEPGVGKSQLVIDTLVSLGYQEMHDFKQPATTNSPFYCMPVSLSLTEKETLLRKAFHEGAVVVIDEINSSPMMERLLNALLMGKTPEGKEADNPGFLIIGTQNPIRQAGRLAPSNALVHRMTKTVLPPYSNEEMQSILITQGTSPRQAKDWVNTFLNKQSYAKQQHLSPAPCFRDLLTQVQETIKHSPPIEANYSLANQISTLFTPTRAVTKEDPDESISDNARP